MLLGKRSRHPMKRTTSMTGITVDVANVDDEAVLPEPLIVTDPQNPLHEFPNPNFAGYDQRFLAMVSPRNQPDARSLASSSNHARVVDTAPFLRSCCLCKRRLAPGRDIYMYRGDTAFCSLECREEQMKQDERKERLNVVANSKKEDRGHASSKGSTSKSEPVAAA